MIQIAWWSLRFCMGVTFIISVRTGIRLIGGEAIRLVALKFGIIRSFSSYLYSDVGSDRVLVKCHARISISLLRVDVPLTFSLALLPRENLYTSCSSEVGIIDCPCTQCQYFQQELDGHYHEKFFVLSVSSWLSSLQKGRLNFITPYEHHS